MKLITKITLVPVLAMAVAVISKSSYASSAVFKNPNAISVTVVGSGTLTIACKDMSSSICSAKISNKYRKKQYLLDFNSLKITPILISLQFYAESLDSFTFVIPIQCTEEHKRNLPKGSLAAACEAEIDYEDGAFYVARTYVQPSPQKGANECGNAG